MKEKSNNKQTSVDYIFNQLSSENLLGLFTHDQMRRAMEILDEAKAMHKEEIKNAHTIGYVIGGGNGYIHEPEQYYNETFGGNK
jgi:hypothetical protein